MHDKSGLMIAPMSQDRRCDDGSPPCAAWTKVEGIFLVLAWNTTQTGTICRHLVAQKHIIFSEKMNRVRESFSPTESVKQNRTKVMQSEIKEEDSRWALHLCFSLSACFWKPAAAVSYSLIPSPALAGLIKNRGALFVSEMLLLRILEMRSSEACRPHAETEHMSRYQPTEQRIPQTISP